MILVDIFKLSLNRFEAEAIPRSILVANDDFCPLEDAPLDQTINGSASTIGVQTGRGSNLGLGGAFRRKPLHGTDDTRAILFGLPPTFRLTLSCALRLDSPSLLIAGQDRNAPPTRRMGRIDSLINIYRPKPRMSSRPANGKPQVVVAGSSWPGDRLQQIRTQALVSRIPES